MDEAKKAVEKKVSLPPGYFVSFGGQFESQRSASRTLALLFLLSFAAMFTALYAHFRSARIVLQILVNIPIALIGAVLAVLLTGGVFSIGTSVGAQQYSQAEMNALVEEAHMLGMKVAAHAHGTNGIKAAIRAGVDTVEHVSFADAEAFDI